MNLYESQGHRDTAHEQLFNIFNQQRSAFNALPYPDLDSRRSKLFKLKKQIIRYQDVIAEAINTDFSSRSIDESKLLDLLGSVLEAEHAIRHLRKWMRPSKRSTELLFYQID